MNSGKEIMMNKQSIVKNVPWLLLYLLLTGFGVLVCTLDLRNALSLAAEPWEYFKAILLYTLPEKIVFSALFSLLLIVLLRYIRSEMKGKDGRHSLYFVLFILLLTAAGVFLAGFGPLEKFSGTNVLPRLLWKAAVSAAYAFIVTALLHFARCQAREKPKKWIIHTLRLLGFMTAAGILLYSYNPYYQLFDDGHHPFVYFWLNIADGIVWKTAASVTGSFILLFLVRFIRYKKAEKLEKSAKADGVDGVAEADNMVK